MLLGEIIQPLGFLIRFFQRQNQSFKGAVAKLCYFMFSKLFDNLGILLRYCDELIMLTVL